MTWTLPRIRQLLLDNDTALERAVVALYRRQTSSEQQSYTTVETNGVGFNAADAAPCTLYAKQILAGRGLAPAQLQDARGRMLKYGQQLIQVAIEKQLQQLTS